VSAAVANSAAADLAPDAVLRQLRAWATELGFQRAAVARVELAADVAALDAWIAAGWHGEMDWFERNRALRAEPARLVPGTVSVVSLRMDYLRADLDDAWRVLGDGNAAYVSRYALGRDYHRILRGRLRQLGERLRERVAPHGYRVFTDSAPVLEKPLARDAGLGWVGKHTNLVHQEDGSFFLLGELFTDLALPIDTERHPDLCGSCTRCIDACPTAAIVAPYRLDARRCISYLTIELAGSIPSELRPLLGNRVFGCDDCQLVCPWNRYAKRATVADFDTRHGLDAPRLVEVFAWDEATFEGVTRGSALRRVSHVQWLRNVAVALGNAPSSPAARAALAARADHPAALVREHVAWALERQDRARLQAGGGRSIPG